MMRAPQQLVAPPDLARLASAFKLAVVGVDDSRVIQEELAKLAAYLVNLESRLRVHDYANMRFV